MNLMASLIRQGQRKFAVLALAGGVAASGTMVYTASSAAFNATTDNPTNSWATGSVLLHDDDLGAARFTVTNIISGSGTLTGTKCIRVDYDGTTATSGLKLYATAVTNPAAGSGAEKLGDYITLKIEQGTGGATYAEGAGHTCASDFTIDDATDGVVFDNTLPSFATHTSYAGGLTAANASTWTPSAPSYKVYRITWDATALPDNTYVQGKTLQCTFTWQAKS